MRQCEYFFASWIACLFVFLAQGCAQHDIITTTAPASRPIDRARWMQDRLDLLNTRSLKQLTLPASHDSAMYLTGFPQSLGRTQNLSIYNQLAEGVRYFDLRPRWNSKDFVMVHGPINGPTLSTVLNDVRRFMNEGHRELIILKFSHYEDLNADRYAEMTTQITGQLAPWLYTTKFSGARLAEIPLQDFLRDHGTVLVVCDGKFPIEKPVPGIWIYRDWDSPDPAPGDLRVFDQYADSTSYPAVKADQFAKFESYNGQCKLKPDVPCDLFLLSWTLTPTTNVPAFAKQINPHLAADLSELKIPNQSGFRVNLLYTDCADTANAIDLAIQLNSR